MTWLLGRYFLVNIVQNFKNSFFKKNPTSVDSFYTYENNSKILRIILDFNMKFELTKLLNFHFQILTEMSIKEIKVRLSWVHH